MSIFLGCNEEHVKYYEKGNEAYDNDNYNDALIYYSKAIELKPDESYYHSSRGFTFLALNKINEALNDFKKEIEIRPSSITSYRQLAKIYKDMEIYDSVIYICSDAIYNDSIDSKWDLYLFRADALALKGEYELALVDYDESIFLFPRYAKAYENRGIVNLILGDTLRACGDWGRALDLNSMEAGDLLEEYCYKDIEKYLENHKDK